MLLHDPNIWCSICDPGSKLCQFQAWRFMLISVFIWFCRRKFGHFSVALMLSFADRGRTRKVYERQSELEQLLFC